MSKKPKKSVLYKCPVCGIEADQDHVDYDSEPTNQPPYFMNVHAVCMHCGNRMEKVREL